MNIFFEFLRIFTWDKSFRKNRFIGSPFLNRVGLHVARVVVAHFLFQARLFILGFLLPQELRRKFNKNGYLVFNNFLPEEQFESLKQELLAYNGTIEDLAEGDTLSQRVYLDTQGFAKLPACSKVLHSKTLTKILRYCSSKNRLPSYYIENIRQHFIHTEESDPQKDLHSDTFHPTVKAWLFIDDVTAKNGAFTYVPESNQLSFKRLRWEYSESLIASGYQDNDNKNRYWNGSFRINSKDLAALAYPDPVSIEVPANTLVVANTHGFHCRGNALAHEPRMSILMFLRDNPFTPFPAPLPQLAFWLHEKVWAQMVKKQNAGLIKRGVLVLHETKFERGQAPSLHWTGNKG